MSIRHEWIIECRQYWFVQLFVFYLWRSVHFLLFANMLSDQKILHQLRFILCALCSTFSLQNISIVHACVRECVWLLRSFSMNIFRFQNVRYGDFFHIFLCKHRISLSDVKRNPCMYWCSEYKQCDRFSWG